MNINKFIKITNLNQFEINVSYLAKTRKKKTQYNISMYLFLPENLDINEQTYLKSTFYNDSSGHIRLFTPRYNLKTLTKRLLNLIEFLKIDIDKSEKFEYINYETKMIVCAYIDYLKEISQNIEDEKFSLKKITSLVQKIKKFNELKNQLFTLRKTSKNAEIKHLLKSSVEYISLITQRYLFIVNIKLRSKGEIYIGVVNGIINIINNEISFEKENDLPFVSRDDNMNEKVIFRYSVFKKFFYSILFLKQDIEEDSRKIRQFYYAIAAGISMMFATTVVFITQQKFGNFTTPFFVALVLSYMFKDRIKDVVKGYFEKKLNIKAYDFKDKIYDMDRHKLFGYFQKKVKFIKKDDLDKRIVKARLLKTSSRLSTWYLNEKILKYEKNITLYNKNIKDAYDNAIEGITDIMRFDITRFKRKMNDTKVPLYRVNHNNLYGERVYHVNMVFVFSSGKQDEIQKIRLVLTKEGIKRIEIPRYGIEIFPSIVNKRDKNWFYLQKDGLLKKIENFND
ncbi:MAG: hypothetical protein GXP61_03250 [Epsilonproteobacteria bacterium]|nr:hypothetical protein [Campylobacterota bacterium]